MKHTMRPRFEKHEDQLFRMLEEPKFLEPGDGEPFLICLIAAVANKEILI